MGRSLVRASGDRIEAAREEAEPCARALQRDRPTSPFGQVLARFIAAHPACLAAVLVDAEGECVDYATVLPVFDALVTGAQLAALSTGVAASLAAQGAGALVMWAIEAAQRAFVVRRVADDLSVVFAVASEGLGAHLLRAAAPLAEALRREAGVDTPAWEPWGEALRVTLRSADGWEYAPATLATASGAAQAVEVLGRWHERGLLSTQAVVCFRVRCGTEELTLCHDRNLDRWQRR